LDAPHVVAMRDTSVSLNDTISITALGTDSNGSILKYIWSDSKVGSSDTTDSGVLHIARSDSGIFFVVVKVLDDDSIVSTIDTCVLKVRLDAPSVTLMNPGSVNINDTAEIIASATDNGKIVKYAWALDGVHYVDTTTIGKITTAFADSGAHTVSVKVIDDDGVWSTPASVKITATLGAPMVTMMSNGSVNIKDTMSIFATGIDNGTIKKYAWALDGVLFKDTTTIGIIKTAFADSGAHTVCVKVVDDDGIWSLSAKVVITAMLGVPIVTTMKDTNLSINDSITITATATDNGTIRRYFWALNGTDFKDSSSIGQIKTVYADSGIYNIKVKVVDDDGIVSIPATTIITVYKDAPAATISGNSTVAINTPITFTAQTFQHFGTIVRYRWDNGVALGWDDSIGSTYTYSFQAESTITVHLAVSDDDGNVAIVTKTISVTNDAPVVSSLRDTTISIYDSIPFVVTASDNNGIQKYIWDFDDGSPHQHDTISSICKNMHNNSYRLRSLWEVDQKKRNSNGCS
jgi:PKD repeat protein